MTRDLTNQELKIIAYIASFIAVLGFGVAIYKDIFQSAKKEKQMVISIAQADSIVQNLYNSNDKIIWYLNRIDSSMNAKDLKNWKEFYWYLKAREVPFCDVWAAISIGESGWNWESELARDYNNIVGFNACSFKNKRDCAEYCIHWMAFNPPTYKEVMEKDWIGYFRRRNYNTEDPLYYPQITNILVQLEPKLMFGN